jgi:pimeloyl-ACP methyl ester carboxylesterase
VHPGFHFQPVLELGAAEFETLLTGLWSFASVAIVDRRGIGLSDRLYPKDLPSLEVVMDDILTVMDEAGVERAAVFGWQSGATLAALLAATYPAGSSQLVTFGLDPCPLRKPDWPHGWSPRRMGELPHRAPPGVGNPRVGPAAKSGVRARDARR